MKQKYLKLNLSKLPANIKAEFEDIRKATKDFTDDKIMEIEEENFDSLYAIVGKKYPAGLGEAKKKETPKSNLKKALDQDEPGTAKVISKMTSKRKIKFDESRRQELEDGHILMKKSDTEAILQYKGQSNKTVVFTFEGGKWIIDCCDKRGDKYPDYSKTELEDAVDYIISELECKETVQKRKEAVKKRKEYEEKQSKKAADSVEKKIEESDKPFQKIQDDIVKIVDSIKSSMKSRADAKEFIKGLIAELQKLI